MPQDIQLIALDLDGTLLHSDKSISQANHDAVRKAVDAGLHVVLASGRMVYSMAKYAKQLGFPGDAYIIGYSGGMVRLLDSNAPLAECPVDAENAKWVVRFARENGHHLNYYLEDKLYTEHEDHWSELYYERTGCESNFVGDLREFDGRTPTKLVIIDVKEMVARREPELKTHFAGAAQVLITDDEYLEIMANDATKGHALQIICEKIGVPREQTMAMGDGFNDLSMLDWVGLPYAMANGRPELLQRISHHAPPADEDGVAQVINQLLSA